MAGMSVSLRLQTINIYWKPLQRPGYLDLSQMQVSKSKWSLPKLAAVRSAELAGGQSTTCSDPFPLFIHPSTRPSVHLFVCLPVPPPLCLFHRAWGVSLRTPAQAVSRYNISSLWNWFDLDTGRRSWHPGVSRRFLQTDHENTDSMNGWVHRWSQIPQCWEVAAPWACWRKEAYVWWWPCVCVCVFMEDRRWHEIPRAAVSSNWSLSTMGSGNRAPVLQESRQYSWPLINLSIPPSMHFLLCHRHINSEPSKYQYAANYKLDTVLWAKLRGLVFWRSHGQLIVTSLRYYLVSLNTLVERKKNHQLPREYHINLTIPGIVPDSLNRSVWNFADCTLISIAKFKQCSCTREPSIWEQKGSSFEMLWDGSHIHVLES